VFFIPLQERMNTSQIKRFDPKEKSLTTVSHWKVILFCGRNNNTVSSRMIFILGLYVTRTPFANNHTVRADILALKFYSKPNINKNMAVCSLLVEMRGVIGNVKWNMSFKLFVWKRKFMGLIHVCCSVSWFNDSVNQMSAAGLLQQTSVMQNFSNCGARL